jgi:signal transduction histidine kinase/ActR/RegA family two-component response regulator
MESEKEVEWKSLDICKAAGMGLWVIEMDEGEKPRFYMDDTFLDICGMPKNLTPEEQYDVWYAGIVEDVRSTVDASIAEMIKTGKSENTYAFVHPTKGRIYVRCGGTQDKSYTKGVRLRGYHQDVTSAYLEIQRQKNISQSRLDKIDAFSSIYFVAWEVDIENNKIFAIREPEFAVPIGKNTNGIATEAFNMVVEEYVEPEFKDTMTAFLRFTNIAGKLAEKNEISEEYKAKHAGWCRMVIVPERADVTGSVTDVVIGIQDINEEKKKEVEAREKIEAALQEAKTANMAKTAFLSQMSHDIRTPLNGIIGLLEMSERHRDDYRLVEDNRIKAKTAANHLLALLNDVLELNKLGDGNTVIVNAPFDLIALAEDVISISNARASEMGISLTHRDCSGDMPVRWVFGSERHVRQIFLNILDNAVKYNKAGGSVRCWTDVVERDENSITYRFNFEDTGIGMSEKFIQKIYEPFTQESYDARSAYQGTGLGMTIVKNLVDRMNGTIDIQSELGVGSRFSITIPFEKASSHYEDEQSKETVVYDISGANILLVEDNELNMEIASYLLKDAGANVTEATDGKQAVESFIINPPGTYDIIVMDLMMPVMGGLEASMVIRSYGRSDAAEIPIIAMTANAFEEDIEAVKKAGMNEHIPKPLDTQKVLKTISKYYKRRS